MIRWRIFKKDKESKELIKRFTDIQYEIDEWKALQSKAGWADARGIQKLIDNTLVSLEND